jgi:hypothetical protein
MGLEGLYGKKGRTEEMVEDIGRRRKEMMGRGMGKVERRNRKRRREEEYSIR